MKEYATITSDQWAKKYAEANEAAGEHGEPDWVIAFVRDTDRRNPWLWYIALPMAGLDHDQFPFVVHEGSARTEKRAIAQIAKHIEQYDGEVLGRDPRGPLLAARSGSLLRFAAGVAVAATLASAGLPGALVWYFAAACVAGGLVVDLQRRRRALGFQRPGNDW